MFGCFKPKEYELDHLQVSPMIASIKAIPLLFDQHYYYVAHKDWGAIFKTVLWNLPSYLVDKFDCDNFALLVMARVAEKYKLNTCGMVVGESPMGPHGFNLFISQVNDKPELFILEPQNGEVYSIEEPHGYKPYLVIMG